MSASARFESKVNFSLASRPQRANLYSNFHLLSIMTTEVEFRAKVRYLQRKGLTGKDIISELREVYEDECPSKSFVYNWMREFSSGRTSVFDDKCGGRPIEIGDSKEQEVSSMIRNNRKITIRELSSRVNLSLGSCH